MMMMMNDVKLNVNREPKTAVSIGFDVAKKPWFWC